MTSPANSAPPKMLHTLLERKTSTVSIIIEIMNTINITIIVIFMFFVNDCCADTRSGFVVSTYNVIDEFML